ncbi:MAG: YbaN family protein [Planctomycetota bacterium]
MLDAPTVPATANTGRRSPPTPERAVEVVVGASERDPAESARSAELKQRGVLSRVSHGVAGVVFVALGAIGVVLPGLPTTIFLILASWCFARSHPWLEAKLLRNRFFGPYMRYVDGSEPMPTRARVISIAMVLAFSTLSIVLMTRGGTPWWAGLVVAIAAGVGVWCIVRQGHRVARV